jgi:hypothetical protein
MNSVYNTTFEVSLRILLTLEASPREWLTSDRIAATDFITVYGKDFGVAKANLHGDNLYRYSEFALRREIVRKALKSLVSRRLTDVSTAENGFVYSLGALGGEYCASFDSGYATEYRELANEVRDFVNGKSEREILGLINKFSLSSIQRRA